MLVYLRPRYDSICVCAREAAGAVVLARRSASPPELNAPTRARMPTFSITIAIRSSTMPTPASSRAARVTMPCLSARAPDPSSEPIPLPIRTERDGRLCLHRDQRRRPGAERRGPRARQQRRARATARPGPAREQAQRASGERRGRRPPLLQGGEAEVAPDLLPPVRDDDRGGSERRRVARHPRGA